MNGFRITILTLLCLSVALMFYVVLYVIPSWQEEYNIYQSDVRLSEYNKKSDLHRQQMLALDPSVESPEEEQARLAEEEAARRNERTLQEAEESIIIEAARRREEAARARAEAEAAAKAEAEARAAGAQPAAIGIVASYDEEWSCIMIKPAVVGAFSQGNTLAVRRNGRIVCEAVVDGMDVESGQVSATVKIEQFGTAEGVVEGTTPPAPGDEVILSPFASSDDLRREAAAEEAVPVSTLAPAPAAGEAAAPAAAPAALPAPAAEEVQRALDAVPTTPADPPAAAPAAPAAAPTAVPADPASTDDASQLRSKDSLPSLDAMLHAPLF